MEKVIERIFEVISKIETEREGLKNTRFDEGFDCGTQLALDLLEEWKGELEEESNEPKKEA